MDDRLLQYYERELTYIRAMAAEFARTYPKIAGRLLLEPDRCEDPHTERLIEAFAFISSRIHKKIDDDFPEITEALLNILYPHYVTPIPSMSIVRFDPIKQNVAESGYRIDADTMLYSKPIRGTPCRFRTCLPLTLWPVEVAAAGLRDPKYPSAGVAQSVVIELKTFNEFKLAQLGWESLRFFLNGPTQHIFHLYELLLNDVAGIVCETVDEAGKTQTVRWGPEHIQPVGFAPHERMMPYPERSFPGYNLLFEYFCFPEKFLYFDLNGLDGLKKLGDSDSLRLWINLKRPSKPNFVVNRDTLLLQTVPVVNLFQRIAEPIRVEHQKTDYPVVPDVRRLNATEVFSIDQVSATSARTPGKQIEYRPFYSIRHHLDSDEEMPERVFWHMQRRASGRQDDPGTDVFLSFTGFDFTPRDPGVEVLTVRTTCTNRDLPARLPFGDPSGDFDMEVEAPVAGIAAIIKPTPTRRPPLGGELQWRLISHLSLNYISIVQGGESALKEILKLYDFDNSPSTRQQIEGIVSLQAEHVTRRIGHSFCRGVQVTIEFDEDKFVGAGMFLFAGILERFLAQYVSVNSFSQLVVKTIQRKEIVKKWPPRSGNQVLL
ncbi:MAG TPA: type VI secretion system baseplate subunit TssF [Desulfobacterales bacterium]